MIFIVEILMVWFPPMQSPSPPNSRRPPSGPKTVGESAPVALMEKARMLAALDGQLRLSLPEPLRHQCCLADIRSGRIVFLASSPAWAAKLRLQQNLILAQARQVLGADIRIFAVKVADLVPVPPEPTRRKPLSFTAANHLKAAAKSLSDPELRALYLQLASLAE